MYICYGHHPQKIFYFLLKTGHPLTRTLLNIYTLYMIYVVSNNSENHSDPVFDFSNPGSIFNHSRSTRPPSREGNSRVYLMSITIKITI